MALWLVTYRTTGQYRSHQTTVEAPTGEAAAALYRAKGWQIVNVRTWKP